MIKINSLSFKYNISSKTNKFMLNIPNLELKDSSIIGICGMNGSGKSTLINLICDIYKPQSGTIEMDFDRNEISGVLQDSGFDDLKLKILVPFFQKLVNNNQQLELLLNDYELLESKDLKFNDLSFGQRQRFRFMISQLKEHKLLILDEVTSGMDAIWKKQVYDTILESKRNDKLVLMITHDINELAYFCDRIIYFENGKLKKDFLLTEETKKDKMIKIAKEISYLERESEIYE